MDTSSDTHPNIVDETTNSHVNIDDKDIELLIIASLEIFKSQNKNCGKDEIFALAKDSLQEAIKMESFQKSLVLLQASYFMKFNIISNRTCLSIPKHSSVPKVCTPNTSRIKTDFEDFKSSFIETLNVQTELFMNQKKELFFTEMNSFKNELLTSLKHNTKSHSHEPSNNTDIIISLLQDQIEIMQEQLKSLIENLSRNDDVFFSQKVATLKVLKAKLITNNYKNTKTIERKESQNRNTPRCFSNKEKESQKDKQEEDISKKTNKNMARS